MEAKDREKSCCSQEEGPKTTAHPVEDIAAKRPRLDLEAQEVTSSSLDTKPSAIASEATTISSQAIPKRSGKPRRTADPKLRAAEAREKEIQAFKETMPNNIVFRIKNGIRYCSPYWGTYKTETKGRWVGRKLTEVFQSEFLSFNPNYVVAAARRGRIIINGKQMNNIDHVMKLGEKIQHIAHRHEHPVLDVPIQILAETEDMMVVNKPASMPVHACGNYKIHTVLGLLWKLHGIVGLRG
ncbi:unnamed protein product [Bursaphelenchus okinawaensis]|uniref:Pseudouridine synthase RsuA/RluA-like domain-containing protein n=1 Tax=Bursaphelenchus okinawaensis TaxID=465554 RepID=A0A811K0Q4_9BILA|nr:unnamed protein product [Bursaphelenchus okinawaensis]CAG9088769.1 unnamed protein product [Bursaphelenchus okinawaensis]